MNRLFLFLTLFFALNLQAMDEPKSEASVISTAQEKKDGIKKPVLIATYVKYVQASFEDFPPNFQGPLPYIEENRSLSHEEELT